MCSALTPDDGFDNSIIISLGDVYCPNEKCLGTLFLHERTFKSLGRSDDQCPQGASVWKVRNIHFEVQTIFFVVCPRDFLRESKMISRSYWKCLLSWQVLFQQRKMPFS